MAPYRGPTLPARAAPAGSAGIRAHVGAGPMPGHPRLNLFVRWQRRGARLGRGGGGGRALGLLRRGLTQLAGARPRPAAPNSPEQGATPFAPCGRTPSHPVPLRACACAKLFPLAFVGFFTPPGVRAQCLGPQLPCLQHIAEHRSWGISTHHSLSPRRHCNLPRPSRTLDLQCVLCSPLI
jgi:hypothetical protein